MRTYLVRRSTLNIATGETTPQGESWVTGPCGVPLFGDAERARGTCRACARGWETPTNYPGQPRAADHAPQETHDG